jgi:hypothetical protein
MSALTSSQTTEEKKTLIDCLQETRYRLIDIR